MFYMFLRPLLIVSSFLFITPTYALDDKADFKAAYAAYNQALEAGEPNDILDKAYAAYLAGEKIYQEADQEMIALALNYGNAWVKHRKKWGEWSHVVKAVRRAVDAQELQLSENDSVLLDGFLTMADVYAEEWKYNYSDMYLSKARKIIENTSFQDINIKYEIYFKLGQSQVKQVSRHSVLSRLKTARHYFEKAIDVIKSAPESAAGKDMIALANFNIAKTYHSQKRDDKAETFFKTAIEHFQETDQMQEHELSARAFLISVYTRSGREK